MCEYDVELPGSIEAGNFLTRSIITSCSRSSCTKELVIESSIVQLFNFEMSKNVVLLLLFKIRVILFCFR
jgi:hypothetical protein